MKREDAKNKIPGITEEQLNWLMQENGSDITREKFLSTLSLRRATHRARMVARSPLISIHALLAESDYHMPPVHVQLSIFLSTLSLRRATLQGRHSRAGTRDFYPRSPCGERLVDVRRATGTADFYPRSPCGERPPARNYILGVSIVFLSTLSLRRATYHNNLALSNHTFLSTLSLRRATRVS